MVVLRYGKFFYISSPYAVHCSRLELLLIFLCQKLELGILIKNISLTLKPVLISKQFLFLWIYNRLVRIVADNEIV